MKKASEFDYPSLANASRREVKGCNPLGDGLAAKQFQEDFQRKHWGPGSEPSTIDEMDKYHDSCKQSAAMDDMFSKDGMTWQFRKERN